MVSNMVAAITLLGSAAVGADPGPVGSALRESKPLFDTRLRFEDVDQEPMAREADALTLRSRIGVETGKAWNTALLAEGEFLWPLGTGYNSTTNRKTLYPVVADPESYEINRLQLVNTSIPATAVTLGRQRIALDDQRFVGNVGWRQNEQTFDALRVVNRSIANLTIDVSYLDQVNRIYGKHSVQGRYNGDNLLANVAYQMPVGKLTAFGYWLQIDPIAGVPAAVRDSSATYGLRFAGERALSRIKLGYSGSYATQRSYGDNPLNFANDYHLVELTAAYRQYSFGIGAETLEGNGVKGFTTPLATLHKFQGWADKFLTTPVDGIEDRYLNVGATLKGVGVLDTLALQASYHDYESQRRSQAYGDEFNVQVAAKYRRFQALVKYAQYHGAGLLTDTAKFWVQVEHIW